jgi:hypothetical protein
MIRYSQKDEKEPTKKWALPKMVRAFVTVQVGNLRYSRLEARYFWGSASSRRRLREERKTEWIRAD